jgi:dihydroflavonol-4-reductase
MKISGSSVLVTGAGGTVGSVVVERLLREGAHVRALVRSVNTPLARGAEPVLGDLGDPAALRRAVEGMAWVVHCAAAVSPELELGLRINREGTRALLQAMEETGCRALVHVSTVSVYDYRAGLEFDEASPVWTEPLDGYGFSKAEGERLVLEACSRGLGANILRPALVLSTHPRSFWGPLALQRARASPGPVVPVAEVPYVHVENLAEAIVLAARGPLDGRVYNVVDGVGATQEYLDAVGKALGRAPEVLPAGAPRLRYSGARIRSELGYAPADRWREFLTALSTCPA